jgi:2-polyprenyl-3-methyl-5-hydroxy-6-metoxy-1,4-benzoquinol methylase
VSVYDDMAGTYAEHASDSAYDARYDRPAVFELVGDVAGRRVLDAGCGPGLYSEELVARGADLVAIDASAEMVKLAEKRIGSRAQVMRADLNEPLPFASAEFDLIVCALVIHHVHDRNVCFREFLRLLKPGGRAIVSTQHRLPTGFARAGRTSRRAKRKTSGIAARRSSPSASGASR